MAITKDTTFLGTLFAKVRDTLKVLLVLRSSTFFVWPSSLLFFCKRGKLAGYFGGQYVANVEIINVF